MSIISTLALIVFGVWFGCEFRSYRLVHRYYKNAGRQIDYATKLMTAGTLSKKEAAETIVSADRDLQALVSGETEKTHTRMMSAVVVLVALAVIGWLVD